TQLVFAARCLQAFDGDFVIDAGDDDLSVVDIAGAVYGQQIVFKDAGIDHAVTLHAQEIIGAGMEEAGGDIAVILDILFGEDGVAGGDAADDGDALVFLGDTDAARGAGDHLDRALAGQRLQMLFGGVGRFEAEFAGDIGAGRGIAGFVGIAANQIQNFLLTLG